MVVAHIPAGYLLSHVFSTWRLRLAVIVGSIAPDVDLIYFYTIGQRAIIHHDYLTHMPVFWLGLALAIWPVLAAVAPRAVPLIPAFTCGALLHLVLDSITGSVHWLVPFSEQTLTLVTVTARYHPWLLNFIFHWTFGLEILLCGFAGFLLFKRKFRRG